MANKKLKYGLGPNANIKEIPGYIKPLFTTKRGILSLALAIATALVLVALIPGLKVTVGILVIPIVVWGLGSSK